MAQPEAIGMENDIHEIKEAVNDMRDTINGIGQAPGLVGRVAALENDKIDPRVFERMLVKMNIICWIGGIVAAVLIVGITTSWRYDAEVTRAQAAMAQPSSLAEVFDDHDGVPPMSEHRYEYVDERYRLQAIVSGMDRMIKASTQADGPIRMTDGTTYPHDTPSYTRAKTRATPATKTD